MRDGKNAKRETKTKIQNKAVQHPQQKCLVRPCKKKISKANEKIECEIKR